MLSWSSRSWPSALSEANHTLQGSELKSSWLPPNPVASNHTYLKTILLIFAFTSCWVENESNGNSRQGVELDWNAPTLTGSGRHGAQRSQSRVKSNTFLREEKSPERLLALPPAHSTNTRARAFSSPLKEGSRKQEEHLEGNSRICWWSVLTAPIQPSPPPVWQLSAELGAPLGQGLCSHCPTASQVRQCSEQSHTLSHYYQRDTVNTHIL